MTHFLKKRTSAAVGTVPAGYLGLFGDSATSLPSFKDENGVVSALVRSTYVNLLDYGADATGVADSSTAIANAAAACGVGGTVLVPAGTFKITGTVTISTGHVRFLGTSREDSTFITNHATADMFLLNNWYCGFENLTFDSSVTRAGGYYVNGANGFHYNFVRQCNMQNGYDGFRMAGVLPWVDDLDCRNMKRYSTHLTESTDKWINALNTDHASIQAGSAGVRVDQTASLRLTNCNIIHEDAALDLNAANGITIPSIEAVNCFFDNSTYGLKTTIAGTGAILRSKFTSCWFGSAVTAGIWLNATTGDGFTFVNCDILLNAAGIKADAWNKWTLVGCRIAGNTVAGISTVASATHWPRIIGCDITPQSPVVANFVGISAAAGTYKGFEIVNTNVTGNTTNFTNSGIAVATADAANFRIADSPGLNPKGAVTTPAVPATTVVATNTTGYRVTVYIKAGTVTVITVNGVVSGLVESATAVQSTVQLDPGGTIAMTFTVAPTWVWVAN